MKSGKIRCQYVTQVSCTDAEEASSEKEGELEKLLEGRESLAAESDKLDWERGIPYGLTYGT